MDKLRNTGLLNKPFETDLYVNNSDDNKNNENGIYQCALSVGDLGIENNGGFSFTIADENGNTVYGVEENTRVLDPFSMSDSSIIMSFKEQVFLNSSLTGSIKANMVYCNVVILRIDVRAGVGNPLITMFGVYTNYGQKDAVGARIYGDVDNDNAVTISDATAIQIYLAELSSVDSLVGTELIYQQPIDPPVTEPVKTKPVETESAETDPTETDPTIAPEETKSIEEVADEVLKGLWGNGADRKSRVKAAGYDPDEVQAEVNELLISSGSGANNSTSTLTHTVVSGDSLSAIAGKYGTTVK